MSQKFVIGWYSKLSQQAGVGSTRFELPECQRLCDEFNRRFPHLEHFAVNPETKEIPAWDNTTK
jgi:hypothetical protein